MTYDEYVQRFSQLKEVQAGGAAGTAAAPAADKENGSGGGGSEAAAAAAGSGGGGPPNVQLMAEEEYVAACQRCALGWRRASVPAVAVVARWRCSQWLAACGHTPWPLPTATTALHSHRRRFSAAMGLPFAADAVRQHYRALRAATAAGGGS